MLQLPRTYSAARLAAQYVRNISTSLLNISEEVRGAMNVGKPVVALESAIITHGLPFPTNVEMALGVEDIIRSEGAVPATIAFLKGQAHVGLSGTALTQLAETTNAHKVSRRDISYVAANGLDGGTTISGTMILAHMAGIKVFATGGLGGVHRGVSEHWDISADLEQLGRTPVAVVCSGPKSILDIPKTVEYLETKGCHVSTYCPPETKANIPGFFVTDSGVSSPFNFHNPQDAAAVIRSGYNFGLQSGYVFCVPVPPEMAMNAELANAAIEFALSEAEVNGITGKATTPYLLKKVWEATGGDSVKTNVEFVRNNARMAAQIARQLCDPTPIQVQPTVSPGPFTPVSAAAPASSAAPATASTAPRTKGIHMPVNLKPESPVSQRLGSPLSHNPDVLVIGALSQDITCTLETENISVSSFPGRISTSLGGTAHNVALASAYAGAKTRLVSCIGNREETDIAKGVSPVLDVSGVFVSHKDRTPRYVCTNDRKGELIIACADMDAVANLDAEYVSDEIKVAKPKVCVFDGNLGEEGISAILQRNKNDDSLILFEPTSVPKAARLAHQPDLGVFPNCSLDIATPNYLELMSMFEEFSFKEKFDVKRWFPVIDQLPLSDATTRMKLDIFSRSHPALENVVQSGLVQASVQLLPYIPNIFVTTGPNGVISFQLIENLRDRTGGVKDGPNSVYILSRNQSYGVLIQHFTVVAEVMDDHAKSVNGIGDTFCGALVAQLAKSRLWLRDDGPVKKEAVERAMHAASLSLQTYQAVNSEIATLFE